MSAASKLAELAARYAAANVAEDTAISYRRDLAAQIAALTGHTSEGQKTYDAGDDWKVTVKIPMNRKMDWVEWDKVKGSIPADLWPVEMKPSLDEKGVKWLQANDPRTYLIVAQCLTTTPGALSVSVKPTKE